MFFISKRKFEDKVREKVEEAMIRRDEYERYERTNELLYKLECRINRLEHPDVKDEHDEVRVHCSGGGN